MDILERITSQKINTVFVYGSKTYVIKEYYKNSSKDCCRLCQLKHKCWVTKCSYNEREDGKEVYFKDITNENKDQK